MGKTGCEIQTRMTELGSRCCFLVVERCSSRSIETSATTGSFRIEDGRLLSSLLPFKEAQQKGRVASWRFSATTAAATALLLAAVFLCSVAFSSWPSSSALAASTTAEKAAAAAATTAAEKAAAAAASAERAAAAAAVAAGKKSGRRAVGGSATVRLEKAAKKVAGPGSASCLAVAACSSESEALLLLRDRAAAAADLQQHPLLLHEDEGAASQQQHQQQQQLGGADAAVEKETQQQILEEDVQVALQRGWWATAKEVILYSHMADVDISSVVRQATQKIRGEIEEVVRLLDKRHHEIQVVPPAFQWAQSPVEIFLNIKFAYRWSSPGALSVSDPSFLSEPRGFFFSGIGLHSGVKKKYSLSLALYGEIEPQATKHSFASVGRVVVTLQKKKMGVWERLTEDSAKISNMNIWWDLKEKYQKDIEDFRRGNYTNPSSVPADPSTSSRVSNNDGSNENSSTGGRSGNNSAKNSSANDIKKGSPQTSGSKNSSNGGNNVKPSVKADAQSRKGSAPVAASAREQKHDEEL